MKGLLIPVCLLFGVLGVTACIVAQPPTKTEETPSHAVLLKQLSGDSQSRLQAMRFAGKALWESPEQFYAAITKCMDDEDVKVRRLAVIYVGQYLVLGPAEGKQQDPQAIKWLIEQTHDEDYRVVYNCVYYGLAAVKDKEEALIDRLLDILLMRRPTKSTSVLQRVAWGCRPQAEQTAGRIQVRLDSLDPGSNQEAENLTALHLRLTNRYPKNLDRFQGDGVYLILLGVTPPFFPNNEQEVETRLRERLGNDDAIEKLRCRFVNGECFCALLIKGFGDYVAAMEEFADGREFKIGYEIPPFSIEHLGMEKMLKQIFENQEPEMRPLSFEEPFRALYDSIGSMYPNFELKGIDWKAVGDELLPRSKAIRTRAQFCLLCQELVARLEDSHAYVGQGSAKPVYMPIPRWDPGFACLIDDQDRPVIYHLDPGSPAEQAGLRVGMVLTHINDRAVAEVMAERMAFNKKYVGYSSDRYLSYQTARWLGRQMEEGAMVTIDVLDDEGARQSFKAAATMDVRYLPRLPVPIQGIDDAGNVSWKQLDDRVGYIYVRRLRADLPDKLDAAVKALENSQGLIIDVRGNSGGGFDAARSFRNFDPEDQEEPDRPRFAGPIAVSIDARCISAGEGWASWFQANDRARFFGETTAGASSRKTTIDVMGGVYKVTLPIKAYKGFLDRPIERRGLEPDVPLRQSARDLARGVDTVLEAAKEFVRDPSR